jgi:hypothetical protein
VPDLWEALELCDRGYVLETGRVLLAGLRDALLADARVQRAYVGARDGMNGTRRRRAARDASGVAL